MKFSALNVDFNGPSLDLLRSRKPVHVDIKQRYPVKVAILRLGQSSVKTGAGGHGQCLSQQAPVTSFSVVSTSITLKDSELPK